MLVFICSFFICIVFLINLVVIEFFGVEIQPVPQKIKNSESDLPRSNQ